MWPSGMAESLGATGQQNLGQGVPGQDQQWCDQQLVGLQSIVDVRSAYLSYTGVFVDM